MRNYQNKSLSDSVGTVGSMLLFLLFTGCMLMIIAVAAGTYSRISSNFDKTFGASATLRYVSNKIKSSESAEIVEDGRGLVLKSGGITNIIYCRDGALYEKSISSEDEPEISGGDKIFDLKSLNITENGSWYRITIVLGDEESFTLVRR
ncbi:MAG: DUF4860 domain-containing protein [Oscillospiraceae bacterium]|nr:DUF4860 domain-containing protein [Oscillospiraceae bacterium]